MTEIMKKAMQILDREDAATSITERIIEALTGAENFTLRTCGMHGVQCIGLDLDRDGQIMELTAYLIEHGLTADEVTDLGDQLRSDSVGRGIVIYWPHLKLTPEQCVRLADDDGPEEDNTPDDEFSGDRDLAIGERDTEVGEARPARIVLRGKR